MTNDPYAARHSVMAAMTNTASEAMVQRESTVTESLLQQGQHLQDLLSRLRKSRDSLVGARTEKVPGAESLPPVCCMVDQIRSNDRAIESVICLCNEIFDRLG